MQSLACALCSVWLSMFINLWVWLFGVNPHVIFALRTLALASGIRTRKLLAHSFRMHLHDHDHRIS